MESTYRSLGCQGEDDAAISVFGLLSSVLLSMQLIMNIINSNNNNNNNNNNDNNDNNNNNMNDNSMVMTMVTNTNMNSGRKKRRTLNLFGKDLTLSRELQRSSLPTMNDETLEYCTHFLICSIQERQANGHKTTNVVNQFE